MQDFKTININDLGQLGDVNVIDIREAAELSVGTVAGSKHVPMMGLIMNKDQFLNKNEKYYIYCAAGGRSYQTCSVLADAGYDVVNLDGGYSSYRG